MLEEFVIPKQGARCLQEAHLNLGDVADLVGDLSDHDALYITEDSNYDCCEELARGFLKLQPRQRTKVCDALAANLSILSSSAQNLLSNDGDAEPEVVLRHKNGLKMLVYLLHMISMQAEKDSQQAQGAENVVKPKSTGRGRKAAAAADADDAEGWDWQHSRQRVLLAVRELMLVDLKALFRGVAAAEQLVNLCMELALQGLECPNIAKQDAWIACRDVLVRGAVLYQQLDFVAAALFERARQHDHLPQLVAELAKFAEQHCNSTQLGVKLLAEFCQVSPEDYDVQYGTNQKFVNRAGELLTCLAELLPKAVSNNISQLQPYLGCAKAYKLRSSLLEAVGSILIKVYPSDALSSSLGEGATAAHLRSKGALLALLHVRMLDKVSFVRQTVLQTWAKLVENSCVPLPQWNSLVEQAVGRLEDESQLVVKAALQLLFKMVQQSIFPPPLDAQCYMNTLRQAEEQLAELLPKSVDEEAENEASAADGGARWEEGDIQIKEEPVEQQPEEEQPSVAADGHAGKEAAINRLRVMIANLKEGFSFCSRLSAALPQLQVLLASPHAAVVHDAIVFLTLCKKFEVAGAAKALRGMWPLVFSKHEPVRNSVLDSWHIMHMLDKNVVEQVDELLTNVILNSSLAELAALESIMTSLVQKQDKLAAALLVKRLFIKICKWYAEIGDLPAAALQQASKQSAQPIDPMDADAATVRAPDSSQQEGLATEIISSLRRAFALLTMLTAAQPSVLVQDPKYVPVLLDIGFSRTIGDAWLARHTCLICRNAAPHITPSNSIQAAMGQVSSGPAAVAAATSLNGTEDDLLSTETLHEVLSAVVKLLIAQPPDTMAANWPSAAEAAVGAIYALSPQPQELMAAVLKEMFMRCKPGDITDPAAASYGYSAAALSRFFFVLGRTALQHLLCVEQIGKAIRAARVAADRAAAEAAERHREAAAAGGRKSSAKLQQQQQQDDIGALLGAGSVAADAELDALVEMLEAQVLAKDQLLGVYGQLLSRFCYRSSLLGLPQDLQASALLALTQLMAVDMQYCSDHVQLVFSLLIKYRNNVSIDIRKNMVVSMADLASRFPNVIEPCTTWMYDTLTDPAPSVRLAALSSLTHLVLGGMVKAKGNVAKVAALLVDDNQDIVDRAGLFFQALADTGSGNTRSAAAAAGASAANPVYNLLPDILSALLTNDQDQSFKRLREEQLQVIMGQLLAYVKDKQADSLRERLVGRLAAGGPREWRVVAWCIGQLGYTEKGLRRMIELTPSYRHALGEDQVFDMFMHLAEKARRSAGTSRATAAPEIGSQNLAGAQGDLRTVVEEWVADLMASKEAAVEAAEVEAAELARQQRQQQQESAGQEAADADEQSTQQAGTAAAGTGEGFECIQEHVMEDSGTDAEHVTSAAVCESSTNSSGEQDEQIVLLQPEEVLNLDCLGEAAEAAAVAAGLTRLSLGGSRPSSAAFAPTAALGRRSLAASTAASATQRRSNVANKTSSKRTAAASTARRASKAAPASSGNKAQKGYSSDSNVSSGGDESISGEDISSVSSSDDDDGAVSDDQQPAPRSRRGGGGRPSAAAAKFAPASYSQHQQQDRLIQFDDSEDDD